MNNLGHFYNRNSPKYTSACTGATLTYYFNQENINAPRRPRSFAAKTRLPNHTLPFNQRSSAPCTRAQIPNRPPRLLSHISANILSPPARSRLTLPLVDTSSSAITHCPGYEGERESHALGVCAISHPSLSLSRARGINPVSRVRDDKTGASAVWPMVLWWCALSRKSFGEPSKRHRREKRVNHSPLGSSQNCPKL